jgi:hypothetical protein
MDYVVSNLEAVFAYMDDSHLIHLKVLFAALAANGLVNKLEKCVFAVPTLEILGHTILVASSGPKAGHCRDRYLVGPLQFSNNCNYIFTIVDCTSKWMDTIFLVTSGAADCAWALVFHWINHYGVATMISSGHRLQFTSSFAGCTVQNA